MRTWHLSFSGWPERIAATCKASKSNDLLGATTPTTGLSKAIIRAISSGLKPMSLSMKRRCVKEKSFKITLAKMFRASASIEIEIYRVSKRIPGNSSLKNRTVFSTASW